MKVVKITHTFVLNIIFLMLTKFCLFMFIYCITFFIISKSEEAWSEFNFRLEPRS